MGFTRCCNHKCKNYYEEVCEVETMGRNITLGRSGECEYFEPGVHPGYSEDALSMIENPLSIKVQMHVD